MKLYKKGRLLQLISILCTLTIIGSIIPLGLLTKADSVSEPTVYINNYEEELLGSFIAKNGITGTVEYSLFKENENTVMKYSVSDRYGQTYINGIYMPDTITQANLDSYSWSYPFVAKAKSGKNYLSVSFRYKIASFDSDCSQAVFKLATFNAANAYSNINARETLAVATTVGEWTTVNAIVDVDCTGVDWQKNGLGIGVYDTRGELYIDDVVIKDYTATNAVYASYNTLGGDAIEGGIINSSNELPIAQKENEEFVGWYLDSGLTNAFDFDTYDRAESGFKVTLYAKYSSSVSSGPAPVVYRNNYEEGLLGSFIAKNGMTGTAEYSLFKENENTVMKYSVSDRYGQTYINGIYMPDTITQDNLNSYSWSYPFVAKAKSGKNYLSVSFRYKIASFDSDCSQAVFKLATFNAANAYSNINARETLAVATTVGEWTTVNAIVDIDCTGVDWQSNGLAIALYDTRGELYIDDIVIKDYTETNSIYVTYDTGDGDAIASGFVSASEQLPTATKENAEFLGWYLDSGFENAFDFDTYDRAQNGFKVTLYAKFKSLVDDGNQPIVYNNTFEEDYIPTIYAGAKKYNSFSFVKETNENTVLKYSLAYGEDYDYGINYCSLYNDITKTTFSNGNRKAIFKISFRYKVESLASDSSSISVSLSSMHTGNCWAGSNLSSTKLVDCQISDEWQQFTGSAVIDTKDADWQHLGLGLALSGRGVMYIDDVVIEDLTDTDALLISFDTCGGDTIDSGIYVPEDELPKAVRGKAEFLGWYLDNEFKNAFDFNSYDRAKNGCKVTLYACYKDSHAGTKIYTDTFEEDYIPSLYAGAKKYNSFSFVKENNENTVLKFSLAYGEGYDYFPNYCALYDNTNKEILLNGTRAALYRISFRYKVESLGKDCGSINVSLSSMHTANCWAGTNFSSKELVNCVVTDGWQEFTGCAIIDTQDADWQQKGLGIAITGRGVMYIDDIVIEDLTDTSALLLNFDTCGGEPIVSNAFFPEDELPTPVYGTEEFVKWYLDSELYSPFDFSVYDREENGFEVTLYARYKNIGFEFIDPSVSNITFDQDFVTSLYNGQNKSDSFTIELVDSDKALKYNKQTSSDKWNAILLYNDDGTLLGVKPQKRIYRVSFQYKVESLGADTEGLIVGLGLSDTDSIMNFDSISTELLFSGTNDDWQEFSMDFALDATNAENQVLALAVSGAGEMVFDDIVIKDYTDTNAVLLNFETNGGNALKSKIAEKKSDVPTPEKDGNVFKGWFIDEKFEKYFEFYEYDRSQSGNEVKLFAYFSKLIGDAQPQNYYNSFEEPDLDSVYAVRTKYNSFDIVRLPSGNKAMQYSMNVGDDYDYSVSYCTLYNDVKQTVFSNGNRIAFYRISFRYRVDSLAADCERINIAISSMHTGNCWADGVYDGIEVVSSGITNGWSFCEQYVAIDTFDAHWQQRGLGLRVSGRGLAYVDDVRIEDYTDSGLNGFFLITSGGEVIEPLIGEVGTQVVIPTTVSKFRNEFENWCTDRRCTKNYEGDSVITEGLTPLYAKWKQETVEYEKFEPKVEEREKYTYNTVYKGGKLGGGVIIDDYYDTDDEFEDKTENETDDDKKVVRRKKVVKRVVRNGGISLPLIIGLSVGGAVIVAAVIILIILIRRKKRRLAK